MWFQKKAGLIYSKADMPVKQKNKKSVPVNKLSDSVKSSKMQSHTVSRVEEKEVVQCINKKVVTSPTVFNNKNCQAEKSVNMWPTKPKKDMWSNGSAAMLIQHKILKKQEDDKNCQSIKNDKTKYDALDSQSTVLKCSDKKCQENENIDMWPVKPQMDVLSEKPAMKLSNKKSIGLNKNSNATVSSRKQKKCEYDDLKVSLPSVLTRTVKKIRGQRSPEVICSQ